EEKLRAMHDELVWRAFHDELTGLPNRAFLADRLGRALRPGGRGDTTVALLFLDLDRFKVVNDSLGHASGDGLLVEIARRISAATRPADTVARMGGDGFVVLVEAEECGLIGALGGAVLRQACLQAATWTAEFGDGAPRGVAVNISARQLAHPRMIDDVAGALTASGLEPGRLCLELTEIAL